MARYAALTMVHQEVDYLSFWLRHYGDLLGRENLYVVTHGGDEAIVEMAKGYRLIYLPRMSVTGAFDIRRFEVLNALANFILGQYDGLIAGDVDELVFVDPALGMSLVEFAEAQRERSGALRAFGFNVFEHKDDDPLDLTKPVLAQRRHARCEQDYCKPLVVFQKPAWTVGYHSALGEPYMPDGLYMAHLHHFAQGVAETVAEQRAETLAANPAILDGRPFRQKWWRNRARDTRNFMRQMSNHPVRELDDVVDDLRADLRANVVPSRWGGPAYKQLAFSAQPEFALRLPERFGAVI